MTPCGGYCGAKAVLEEGGGGVERRRWCNGSNDLKFCEFGRCVELLGAQGGK
jgi:hypothetical protein